MARWRREQHAFFAIAGFGVLVAISFLALTVHWFTEEGGYVHVTALAVEDLGDGRVVVEWNENGRSLHGEIGDDEHPAAMGELHEVAYPPGRPHDVRRQQKWDLLVVGLAFVLVEVGGTACWFFFRFQPRARQIKAATRTAGKPIGVEFVDDNGRWVILARDDRPFDGVAHVGGLLVMPVAGKDPLPASPQTAIVFGDVRRRGCAAVQVDHELVNTTGRIQHQPADPLHSDD